MEYQVLTSSDENVFNAKRELEKKVNNFISTGWKPLGGVSISLGKNDWCYVAQAMTRE